MLTTRNKQTGSSWCDLDPWRLEKEAWKTWKKSRVSSVAHLSLEHVRHERYRSQSIGRVVTSAQPKEIATRTGELLSAKTHRKIKCLALQALSTSTSSITNRKSRFINATHRIDERMRDLEQSHLDMTRIFSPV